MSEQQAKKIIWTPDLYSLREVAEAAEVVLADPTARSHDAYQATYLLTTFRPR